MKANDSEGMLVPSCRNQEYDAFRAKKNQMAIVKDGINRIRASLDKLSPRRLEAQTPNT
jgi:hypothetical protein